MSDDYRGIYISSKTVETWTWTWTWDMKGEKGEKGKKGEKRGGWID
jgi:hypothetical protein